MNPEISIVIRTLNEAKHLPSLLSSIRSQIIKMSYEIVLIDSGSTDKTLEIAQAFRCKITHISKKEFSFGRSLNKGIEFSKGKYLVFISGHCVPKNKHWLESLVLPLAEKKVQLTYGKQLADSTSYWSERQIYKKYFPDSKKLPQVGFFCNNANSAIIRSVWEKHLFDEELTGLEDLDLAKKLTDEGGKIGYIPEAAVYHIHNETWAQIRRRFEREAIALKKIMPNLIIKKRDLFRYIFMAIVNDIFNDNPLRPNIKEIPNIVLYRINQYYGSFIGNRYENKRISSKLKEIYFYPSSSKNQTIEIDY